MPEPALTRRRIWEVDCTLLDAVLTLSFEPAELLNYCRSAGVTPPRCACTASRGPVVAVHAQCHEETPLALLLERTLDLLHRDALRWLSAGGLDAIARRLVGRDLWRTPDLAGTLWAAATAPESPDAEALDRYVRSALVHDGLRSLADRARTQRGLPRAEDGRTAAEPSELPERGTL